MQINENLNRAKTAITFGTKTVALEHLANALREINTLADSETKTEGKRLVFRAMNYVRMM